jgi:hypothetical protein
MSALTAGIALFSVLSTTGAAARVVEGGTYEFPYGPAISFCGAPFLQEGVERGRYRIVARGDQEYYHSNSRTSDTWTNSQTGEFVTVTGVGNAVDHKLTYNADGSSTYVVQFVGTSVMRNADGAVLGRVAGLTRVELVFDEAGEFVSRRFLKTPGQNFDFCATLEQAIG